MSATWNFLKVSALRLPPVSNRVQNASQAGGLVPPMTRIPRPVPGVDYHYKAVFESCGGEGDESLMTGSLDISSKKCLTTEL